MSLDPLNDTFKAIINKLFYKSFNIIFIENIKNLKSMSLGHLLVFSFYIYDELDIKIYLK